MSKEASCRLCGHDKAEILQSGVRQGPTVKVLRCRSCGLVRLDPIPSEAELDRFYRDVYRTEYDPGVGAEENHKNHLSEARSRVARLEPLLGRSKTVLEIGSGACAFLTAVGPLVKEACGIEPTDEYRAWAAKQGLQVFPKLADVDGRRFDLIALFHVLEHVREPLGFLKSLLARLNPGGRLIIEVPNVDDALISLYQVPAYAPFYYQSAHLWYFSAATLERAVTAAGAKARITGIQRYDLSNHMRWMLTGKPGGLGFYAKAFPPSLEEGYARALIDAGSSDTLWAVVEP
ncbi:MAG: class I SAM-dependent methyltransferase [Elusimicrobiota bacterium]